MIPLVRCVRRSTPVLALICAAAAGTPARSQSVVPASQALGPVHSAFGSILGVVADSAGRFRIDSVPPGTYRIGIFHPLLDSLALSIASAPVNITADSALAV